MKKSYMQPLTKVVKIKVENMLTTSTFGVKANSINSSAAGLEIADKEDFDEDVVDELW